MNDRILKWGIAFLMGALTARACEGDDPAPATRRPVLPAVAPCAPVAAPRDLDLRFANIWRGGHIKADMRTGELTVAEPVRFPAGRYLIEPTGDGDGWIIEYSTPFHVTEIPSRIRE